MAKLNLTMQFDDLVKCYGVFLDNPCEKEFLRFVLNQELCRAKWNESVNECKRLKAALDNTNKDISTLDTKLSSARRWLDIERGTRKRVEAERDNLLEQIENVKKIVFCDGRTKLPDETREKLSFLNCSRYDVYSTNFQDRLNTISEFESTMSNLSDISFSRSEDDIDEMMVKPCRKHRSLAPGPSNAKRRCSDDMDRRNEEINIETKNREQLIATTTVTVQRNGPVSAKSVIETVPSTDEIIINKAEYTSPKKTSTEFNDAQNIQKYTPSAPLFDTPETTSDFKVARTPYAYESALDKINGRTHCFITKTICMPEICIPCDRKMNFGKKASKCTNCNAFCHPECRDRVPLPCIPMGTPSKGGVVGYLTDYTPLVPPMIPAIVIHCINEVEQRGLTEMGIYRVPGADKDVRGLKEKFLKGKGAPDLTAYDIHTVCGCLKDFLRSLPNSLVPKDDFPMFVQALAENQPNTKEVQLFKAVSSLPQPNRDTLAFIILHLKRVAAKSSMSKMTIDNLAKVFGPTLIGYPINIDQDALVGTHMAISVVEELLCLPADYWSSFIVEPPMECKTPATLRHTPSTESLMRKTNRKFLATPSSRKRFFEVSKKM